MVLYGITLVPLAEELFSAVPDLLKLFYTDDVKFDGPVDRISRLVTLPLEQGLVKGYFPKLYKSIFICDSPAQEEATKQAFVEEGLRVNMVPGSQYLGAYSVPEKDRDTWVRLQEES